MSAGRGPWRWALLVAVALAAVAFTLPSAGDGASLHMIGSRGRAPAAVLHRIVDEETVVLAAVDVLTSTRALRDPELKRLRGDFSAAYARMRAAEGNVPSPVVATYAGLETPSDFDLLVVEPGADPSGALVFLHGFGGSFALPCWEISQAARRANLVTYCPAMAHSGAWWTADGEAALRRTLAIAHSRGIDRIWLAGLSNGGIGASRLAAKFRGELRGLVLVSGVAADAAAPGVPALVLHGRADGMTSPATARAYARRAGASYVDLDGGHFAMLTHREQALRAIGDFLVNRAGDAPAARSK